MAFSLAYLVKLNIEMNMSKLLKEIALGRYLGNGDGVHLVGFAESDSFNPGAYIPLTR